MRGVVIKSFGATDVFEEAEIPKPETKAGHVIVKIAATSVNTVDMMIRAMGTELGPLSPPLPAILGMDFAGVVDSVGEGVTNLKAGDEVYGCAGGLGDLPGTLCEFMSADAKLCAAKPKTLSMREAAALPLVGITAYEGLVRAQTSRGQKVLVHGGTGGVGHVAVQLAKHMGAEVFSTCSNKSAAAIIEGYGATPINYKEQTVADYTTKYTDGAGFDVVYDSVGGKNISSSIEAAALNGHIATTVSMCELDLTPMHFKGLSLHVVFMLIPMLNNFKREQHHDVLTKLAEIVDAGAVKPLLDENKYSLSEIGKAHDHLASGKAVGKVVVEL